MEIARMEAGQVPAVAALERQCFSEPWSERTLAQELENPRAAFWAASEGGRLAGYAGMHRVLDDGYIATVAVDAAFRRQGVATALLRTLLEDAQIHRLSFVTLEVREGNLAAISFYRKLVFQEVGRRKGFYTAPQEDAVMMTLFLSGNSAVSAR